MAWSQSEDCNVAEGSPTRTRPHVLVADDDPLNLRVAARLLRQHGCTGVLVTDGEQAIRAMQSQRFDLLLLDVHMPVKDGFETLLLIRQSESKAFNRMPVVMVSGDDGLETRQHFFDAGADGYLIKPLSIDTLGLEIGRLTGR